MELIPRARRNAHEYGRLRAYGWLWSVLIAALAVVFIFTALFTAVRVTDAGMAPLIAQNDILLFARLSHYAAAPARGDILAFAAQKGGPICIGRAVGLPGETVTIFEANVYINGMLLNENAYAVGVCADMPSVVVPAGCYFVLPDARAWADVENASSLIVDGWRILGTASVRVSPLRKIALFE